MLLHAKLQRTEVFKGSHKSLRNLILPFLASWGSLAWIELIRHVLPVWRLISLNKLISRIRFQNTPGNN